MGVSPIHAFKWDIPLGTIIFEVPAFMETPYRVSGSHIHTIPWVGRLHVQYIVIPD